MPLVFVDTSAILALMLENDAEHPRARQAFAALRAQRTPLWTTSYVLVEAYALLRRRVGVEATARLRSDFEPLLDVVWVGAELHGRGLDLLALRPRGVSLVDCVSFAAMHEHGIDRAFAYDRHFEEEGYALIGS
jgi:uncharacterized protein